MNPVYYDTIKVCDPFIFFHVRSINVNMKALYTFPQSVGIAGGRPSSSYYFVGSQADNLFYLDPHHTRATIPLRPIPIRQVTPERGSVSPPGHHRSPTSSASSRTGLSTFSYPTALPSPLSKQLSTSRSSGRRPRSLELCQREWQRRVGIVGRSERRWLGCYPDALRDVVQRRGASDVPLRVRAQNHAWVSVQDEGGSDRSSKQGGRGTQRLI